MEFCNRPQHVPRKSHLAQCPRRLNQALTLLGKNFPCQVAAPSSTRKLKGMMTMATIAMRAGLVVGGLTLAMCTQAPAQDNKNLTGSIKIDGSSTVYPITEAV